MDPDANIARQRLLIARLDTEPGDQDARNELAALYEALAGWLKAGGFRPAAPDWVDVIIRTAQLLTSQQSQVTGPA